MITTFKNLNSMIDPLRSLSSNFASPLLDLAARAYLFYAFFWLSGLNRFSDWWNGNFDTQLFLFELEHPVPGLSPEFAAYSATAGELILPLLVLFGLFARFGAAGLLIMTAVIEFTYIHATDHVLWAFLAGMIFIKGPGILSVDYWLVKYLRATPGVMGNATHISGTPQTA